MTKFIHILGARPQFIKATLLVNKMLEKSWDCKIIHTGQHFDQNMSDIFFNELKLSKPDYNLGIHSLSHGEMTGKMIIELEKILIKSLQNLLLYMVIQTQLWQEHWQQKN